MDRNTHDRPLDDDITLRRPVRLARDPVEPQSMLETGDSPVIKMGPPERMLAARKR